MDSAHKNTKGRCIIWFRLPSSTKEFIRLNPIQVILFVPEKLSQYQYEINIDDNDLNQFANKSSRGKQVLSQLKDHLRSLAYLTISAEDSYLTSELETERYTLKKIEAPRAIKSRLTSFSKEFIEDSTDDHSNRKVGKTATLQILDPIIEITEEAPKTLVSDECEQEDELDNTPEARNLLWKLQQTFEYELSNEFTDEDEQEKIQFVFKANRKQLMSIGCFVEIVQERDSFYKNIRMRRVLKENRKQRALKKKKTLREYVILNFIEDGKTTLLPEQGFRDVYNFNVFAYNIKTCKWLRTNINGRNVFEAVDGNKSFLRRDKRRKLLSKLCKFFFIERTTHKEELIFSWIDRNT